ncbi:hypothetical protein [Allorhizocola rhizosphaerae]|uniref:hypothetical protein n=1 Tax=Allorhizocola rhizosphaerae TaxID=1872709 RepID=UPI000E3BA1EE|nr:hypothetical protein [Allorhizocola rhizosphaerae]
MKLTGNRQSQAALLQRDAAMLQQVERVEQSQEVLQQGLTMLVEAMQGLTARVGEVLAYAISDEMNRHMTKPAG